MRICRYNHDNTCALGFYGEDTVIPLRAAVACYESAGNRADGLANVTDLLDTLPHGTHEKQAVAVYDWIQRHPEACRDMALPHKAVSLLRPIQTPGKMLLLAGNYAAHVRESGEVAVERAETFPYVFMKPATTFNDPDASIPIPRVSPDHIDYECELGVVMGRTAHHVSEDEALDYVAGYTVVNDISDRRYRPVPERKTRPKDVFFDWLHGKWHDGFCPMGPCVASAHLLSEPQSLALTQRINDELRQNASTALMVFPVAAVIAFISRSLTLLPGDIIATGTPEGIGMPTGRFLHEGDRLEAAVEGIGVLRNTMTKEL